MIRSASLSFRTLLVAGLSASSVGCDGCAKPAYVVADAAAVATTIPDAAPLNVTPLPTASIAGMVNPQKLPAYAGPTGSVEGTISVEGDPAEPTPADFARCPDAAKIYDHAFREGPPPKGEGPRWLADAIVVITGYGDFFVQEKNEAAEVTIKDCGLTKRTITMTYGQRLDVKNLTRDFWTPSLEPKSTTVLRMATPGGDAVKLYPKREGYHRVVDHDRKYAVSDLYVFLHPLHTSSNVLGTYRIDGIPTGKVKVNTTHPRIANSEATKEVLIEPNVVLRVDFTLVHKRPAAKDAGVPGDAGYYPPLR